jgi:hypothetical protein
VKYFNQVQYSLMNQALHLNVFPADLESILIQQNFGAHEIAGKSNGLSK